MLLHLPEMVPMKQRVLFARIGWMKKYRGPSRNDPGPLGGGSCDTGYKMEKWNFLKVGKTYYGFIRPTGKSGKARVNLERIGQGDHPDQLQNALVIFVAPREGDGPLVVVGWYRNATVYRHRKVLTNGRGYYLESRHATLLDEGERTWTVRTGKGGIGQSNLCYLLDDYGQAKRLRWVKGIMRRFSTYRHRA